MRTYRTYIMIAVIAAMAAMVWAPAGEAAAKAAAVGQASAESSGVRGFVAGIMDRIGLGGLVKPPEWVPIALTVHIGDGYPEEIVAQQGHWFESDPVTGNFCSVTDQDFEWEIGGLPADSGIYIEAGGPNDCQCRIKGTPNAMDFTEFQGEGEKITLTVTEVGNPSNTDSVLINLIVLAAEEPEEEPDPCSEPVQIKVKDVLNSPVGDCADCIDPDDIDVHANLLSEHQHVTFEITGGMAPYRVVWTDFVEDSRHCWRTVGTGKDNGDLYDYVADDEPYCDPDIHTQVYSSWTQNHSWRAAEGYTFVDTTAGMSNARSYFTLSDSAQVTLEGDFANYSDWLTGTLSPLPVDRPEYYGYNPVERLNITVESEACAEPNEVDAEGSRTAIKFRVIYPGESDMPGGMIGDVKVSMWYQDVGTYGGTSGDYYAVPDCNSPSYGPYDDACEAWDEDGFIMALSTNEWSSDEMEDMQSYSDSEPALHKVLEQVTGYALYNNLTCDSEGETGCRHRQIKISEKSDVVDRSVLDVQGIYLFWQVWPVVDEDETNYVDFDIRHILWETKAYYALWSDTSNILDDNIAHFFLINDIFDADGMVTKGGERFIRKPIPYYYYAEKPDDDEAFAVDPQI